MIKQLHFLSISALITAVLAGCSGGEASLVQLQASCPGGASFCLVSCNLGCVQGGCTISEIAQNQRIILEFSQPVDPASVNAATVSITTSTGAPAIGKFLVEGNKITFNPKIQISGGSTLFGFQARSDYFLSVPGGPDEPQAIRSTSGDPLNASVRCALTVSQGIVDLDQAAPRGTLTAPTGMSGISTGVTIVVKFSELIDMSPFQGASTEFSPIKYQVRRPVRDPDTQELLFDEVTGQPLCDLSFPPVRIDGVPRAVVDPSDQSTVVSLRSVIALPSESCIEVLITDQVRDLSGRSADAATFRFLTKKVPSTDEFITEDFARASNFDSLTSSGRWENLQATPGALGGDGRHGSFDVQIGIQDQSFPDRYEWNTDNMVIPGELTRSGEDMTVTNGRFYFTDFFLQKGKELVFKGRNPVQIFVRGKVEIAGTIKLNGGSPAFGFRARPRNTPGLIQGQAGALGGPGGGKGGRGASSGDGATNSPDFNGQAGEDVQLAAGHAYLSRATGTGGRGSVQFPASGKNQDITYEAFGNIVSGLIGAGGGGGGFAGPGSPGTAIATDGPDATDLGPESGVGAEIDLFADPLGTLPLGTVSLDHFLDGGSGGGGGGSHVYLAVPTALADSWKAGAGGTGGGGAIAIRAGNEIRLTPTGKIEARGGLGINYLNAQVGLPMPGGGGSGGSILLQSAIRNGIVQSGFLDTSGGAGSVAASGFPPGRTKGGDGAPGFIRMETLDGRIDPGSTIPSGLTAKNIAVLSDSDPVVGAQSRWFPTRQFFNPEYLYYEVVAEIDGIPKTYSDNPAIGSPANDPNQPLQVMFQGAAVDPTSRLANPETIGPWQFFVGSASGRSGPDAKSTESLNVRDTNGDETGVGNGFRFLLIFDRNVNANTVVKTVTVWFRT